MRELLLLRHAEALAASADGCDIERPLSLNGEAQARAAGAWLAAEDARPGVVLCSPARRAQMTADMVCQALRAPPPKLLQEVYQATPGELLGLLETHADGAERVLLVGHNPGLEQLVALLTEGRSASARGMAPAALAWLELGDAALEPGRARLRTLWSP